MAKNSKRVWVKRSTFILALIPVLALLSITTFLIIKSLPAITSLGLAELFSTKFSGVYSSTTAVYGLLPALWGSFLVITLAMIFAAPISLSLAVISTDFSLGFLSHVVRWMIGVLSGIPPIVYAIMGSTFFALFITPKFMGLGLPPESRPLAGMLPSDGSCTLLGAGLLALLVVPFITPLIDDAIRSVPVSLKEASLALGGNRWHTLTRVTLPFALTGIGNALILGLLIALGDAIIVSFTIGLEATHMPGPLVDVLERVAPLTSAAAGMAGGGFSRSEAGPTIQKSVAAFSGLLLLLFAFVILGLAAYLQKRFKSRLAQ